MPGSNRQQPLEISKSLQGHATSDPVEALILALKGYEIKDYRNGTVLFEQEAQKAAPPRTRYQEQQREANYLTSSVMVAMALVKAGHKVVRWDGKYWAFDVKTAR